MTSNDTSSSDVDRMESMVKSLCSELQELRKVAQIEERFVSHGLFEKASNQTLLKLEEKMTELAAGIKTRDDISRARENDLQQAEAGLADRQGVIKSREMTIEKREQAAKTAKQEAKRAKEEYRQKEAEAREAEVAAAIQRKDLDRLMEKTQSARQSLVTERATERQSMAADRESLAADRESLAADRESLAADRESMAADRAKLKSDRARLESDRAKLESDRTKLESDRAKLESDRTKLESDRADLDQAVGELESKTEGLLDQEQTFKVKSSRVEEQSTQLSIRASEAERSKTHYLKESIKLEQERFQLDERRKQLDAEIEEHREALRSFHKEKTEFREKSTRQLKQADIREDSLKEKENKLLQLHQRLSKNVAGIQKQVEELKTFERITTVPRFDDPQMQKLFSNFQGTAKDIAASKEEVRKHQEGTEKAREQAIEAMGEARNSFERTMTVFSLMQSTLLSATSEATKSERALQDARGIQAKNAHVLDQWPARFQSVMDIINKFKAELKISNEKFRQKAHDVSEELRNSYDKTRAIMVVDYDNIQQAIEASARPAPPATDNNAITDLKKEVADVTSTVSQVVKKYISETMNAHNKLLVNMEKDFKDLELVITSGQLATGSDLTQQLKDLESAVVSSRTDMVSDLTEQFKNLESVITSGQSPTSSRRAQPQSGQGNSKRSFTDVHGPADEDDEDSGRLSPLERRRSGKQRTRGSMSTGSSETPLDETSKGVIAHLELPVGWTAADQQAIETRFCETQHYVDQPDKKRFSPVESLDWCAKYNQKAEATCWFQRTRSKKALIGPATDEICGLCRTDKNSFCIQVSFVQGQELREYDSNDGQKRWAIKTRHSIPQAPADS
ncbi:MAG: hypothetical protein Q9181_007930 [Wetmoreana brouardii]